MTESEDYDLVILGDGIGSPLAAWTFAAEGKRVGVIERRYIGGSCPNITCLPSKNIIHSATAEARNSASVTPASRSIWRAFRTASARWWPA
jgi:pyruvate/2-oxoglutarate dehydrogenase complex dihydrolipoamide dehydrogenase (E3) component